MNPSVDIQALRADTPGTTQRIHLNNAGASLPPQSVVEIMNDYLHEEAQRGGYETAAKYQEKSQDFYAQLAILLSTSEQQVAYVTNATDAYNRALTSVDFRPGDVVLTTNNDYVSNQIAFLQLRDRFGIQVVRADDTDSGGVDVGHIARLLDQYQPKLVAVTHVPTNSGLVQDVGAIGELCAQREVYYLVDACQSAGQLRVEPQRWHCDFLTATFRKYLRGPRGAGFLYVSERVLRQNLEPMFMDLHGASWYHEEAYAARSDARRFELWERNFAVVLGATEALRYFNTLNINWVEQRIEQLADYLRWRLSQLKELRVTDFGDRLCGIVTVAVEGQTIDPDRLITMLRIQGVNTSISWRESALIDLTNKRAEWVLRLSPHYYNTITELDRTVEILSEILNE